MDPVQAWLSALIWIVAAGCPSALAAQDPLLEEYLGRLGLLDLRLTYFERQLEQEAAPATRTELAGKLANAYAEELAASADEPERFARVKSRAEKLLADFPEARSPLVQAALLQADYQQAEALVIRWMENPGDRKPLQQAAEMLERVQPQFSQLHAELAKTEEAAADALDRLTNEAARQAAEAQLKRQRAVAVQSDYFAGWSAYYLGVARVQGPGGQRGRPSAERGTGNGGQEEFATAKAHFARVLDVSDDKNYGLVEADSLGLDSIWRARTAIGLGLAECGLNRLAAADQVFAWLGHSNVPPAIRDQAAYWQLQGLLNVGFFDQAERFAAKQITAMSAAVSPGKSSLCIAAVHGGAAGGVRGDNLVQLGIRGLARMRQFDTADKLIEKYSLQRRLENSFTLAWLGGRRQYLSAEKNKDAEGFKAAADRLTAALALPEAKKETLEAAQTRYYLAWARFRLDDIDTAARLFQEAAIALAYTAPEIASQAAWMHCTCLVQFASKDKRQVSAAIAALESFRRDYPASEEAQQVDVLAARLRQNQLPPQDAIRELARIRPGDSGSVSAQYEICQLQYQLWSKAKADVRKAKPLADDLLKSVEDFLATADKDREGARRLKATLLAVDVQLTAADPAWNRATALLQAVATAAEQQDPKSAAAIEYQYRRLQCAEHFGQLAAASAAAEQLVKHGAGTPYELPALAIAARAADEAVKTASAADRPKRITDAAGIYGRLVSLLGDSPATLAANKNAVAAASKLAQYDEQLEHWSQAAQRLKRLAEAQPKDRRLLRRAGLACFQAGEYQAAIGYWRTLTSGLASGSDEWFEAKYYQLACLEKTDPAAAEAALAQFRVLFPDVKSAAWRDRFAELAARLDGKS